MQGYKPFSSQGAPLTLSELPKHRAFVKRDLPAVENALHIVNRSFLSGRPDYFLSGGTALKFRTSPDFRGKDDAQTGVSLVFDSIPQHLHGFLVEQSLSKSTLILTSTDSRQSVKQTQASAYFIKAGMEGFIPAFADAKLFEGSVGAIPIVKGDYLGSETVFLRVEAPGGNSTYELRIPDLGLLLAMSVNPGAISEQRIRRAVFALVSSWWGSLDETVGRTASVLGRFTPSGAKPEKAGMAQAMKLFMSSGPKYAKRIPGAAEFLKVFFEELSAAFPPAKEAMLQLGKMKA